ncbi:membrane protein insertion efficiency factor YidD [Pseudonocardia nigra]|uniref:membrane protein insertion efficiency factor YidD n=1 Tax=Pseudonocardia nigra TaxID=1921578 RepID=UPI001C5FA1AC|nr:membrane protein insertion efficiency factor YidD [Pseudonocardia nigra]
MADAVELRADVADLGAGAVELGRSASGSGCANWSGCNGGRGGGGRGCDGPCDFSLVLRVSPLLAAAAVVVPPVGGTGLVRALILAYRRWLTAFTPRCPSTPSCSAYALAAVETLGARRGLSAAAERVRHCGRD